MKENIIEKNANRFTGFADVYDYARPRMPQFPVTIIKQYLKRQPKTVVDLGCGTGLSTIIWNGQCKQVIGIEPSDDMRKIAEEKRNDTISFIKAFSHDTGLPDQFADIVVCSQSFHWMEPVATLNEVNRILTTSGVFATVDCDWPPVSDWRIEDAYTRLFQKVHHIENSHPIIKNNFVRYDKKRHLSNIQNSNHFSYAREIVFSNQEHCTADRLISLTKSQGSLQEILKNDPDLIADDVLKFEQLVLDILGDKEISIYFSYRMRIGVK